ncbi:MULTISPECIES: hypothetical protein [Flavobacteriaceae]|uniref:Four helix bundle protein n=2 Tax=Flavobacteriaceae TaxID=49546 RepID=A0A4Y8ATT5_9FLAO|nr:MULTISPECIES: hypothetical protein [Flavobacteriaceae]TEW75301.1 hypothetical protein E2488_07235 [Gramella jeungdoensis]GGK44154.1 hypothetical protein GCM10007963_10330 [Lutibacter litoralis]
MNLSEEGLNKLVIYRKSLDVFNLSRRIANYITDDKDMISMYRSGRRADNYADNLVMNAFRLVPKVVETETQSNPGIKLKYAQSLRYFIDRLYQDCLKLESTKIQGSDFVRMLRKELIILKKIHRRYVKSLV